MQPPVLLQRHYDVHSHQQYDACRGGPALCQHRQKPGQFYIVPYSVCSEFELCKITGGIEQLKIGLAAVIDIAAIGLV